MTYLKVKKSNGTWSDIKQAFIKTGSGWQTVKGIFTKTQNYGWLPMAVTDLPIIFNVSPSVAPLSSTVTTINGSNFSNNSSLRITTPSGIKTISGTNVTFVDSNTLRFNSLSDYASTGTICVIDSSGKSSNNFPYGFAADYTLYGLPTTTLPVGSKSFSFSVRSKFNYGNLTVVGPGSTSVFPLDSTGNASIQVILPYYSSGASFNYSVLFPDNTKQTFTINVIAINYNLIGWKSQLPWGTRSFTFSVRTGFNGGIIRVTEGGWIPIDTLLDKDGYASITVTFGPSGLTARRFTITFPDGYQTVAMVTLLKPTPPKRK